MTVETVVDNLGKILKGIEKLRKTDVLVGVPAAETERQDPGPTNAMLAYVHDNGASEAGIPPRPFMNPGIRRVQAQIAKRAHDAGTAALEGRSADVTRNFEAIGIEAENSIKAVIDEGIPPPLKPATIAARKRRGFAGEKPLIETAQMRNAIIHVVREE